MTGRYAKNFQDRYFQISSLPVSVSTRSMKYEIFGENLEFRINFEIEIGKSETKRAPWNGKWKLKARNLENWNSKL